MKLQEAEKSGLLEKAISLCHKTLVIGRRVLLQRKAGTLKDADPPSIDDWMRNFGEMVLEKVQRCIGQRNEDECQKVQKLVEDELAANMENILNIKQQATTLNSGIVARVFCMLKREPR